MPKSSLEVARGWKHAARCYLEQENRWQVKLPGPLATMKKKICQSNFKGKLQSSYSVSNLCHGSGLSISIRDQMPKKGSSYHLPGSFSEFMEIPLQLQIKQSAAPVKYDINHNTEVFWNEVNHKPRHQGNPLPGKGLSPLSSCKQAVTRTPPGCHCSSDENDGTQSHLLYLNV